MKIAIASQHWNLRTSIGEDHNHLHELNEGAHHLIWILIKYFLMELPLQGTNGMEVVVAVLLLPFQMLLQWLPTRF